LQKGKDLHCNGLINFLLIVLLYITVIKINIITFQCNTLSNYVCALHYITFPGSEVSQNDSRMWNKSYKYKNTYTVQLKQCQVDQLVIYSMATWCQCDIPRLQLHGKWKLAFTRVHQSYFLFCKESEIYAVMHMFMCTHIWTSVLMSCQATSDFHFPCNNNKVAVGATLMPLSIWSLNFV
jgi:hypothetical protein